MLLERLEESAEKQEESIEKNWKFKLKKDDWDYFIDSFKKMQELKLSKL